MALLNSDLYYDCFLQISCIAEYSSNIVYLSHSQRFLTFDCCISDLFGYPPVSSTFQGQVNLAQQERCVRT